MKDMETFTVAMAIVAIGFFVFAVILVCYDELALYQDELVNVCTFVSESV